MAVIGPYCFSVYLCVMMRETELDAAQRRGRGTCLLRGVWWHSMKCEVI